MQETLAVAVGCAANAGSLDAAEARRQGFVSPPGYILGGVGDLDGGFRG